MGIKGVKISDLYWSRLSIYDRVESAVIIFNNIYRLSSQEEIRHSQHQHQVVVLGLRNSTLSPRRMPSIGGVSDTDGITSKTTTLLTRSNTFYRERSQSEVLTRSIVYHHFRLLYVIDTENHQTFVSIKILDAIAGFPHESR